MIAVRYLEFIIFGLILTFPFKGFSENKSQLSLPKVSWRNCDFYLKLENRLKCSSVSTNQSEYLTSFGYKYCSLFKRESSHWDDPLKLWAKNTSACLQEMLHDNINRISPCTQLESFAYDTHPICYKQYGYCKLSSAQRRKIEDLVSTFSLLEHPSSSLAQFSNIYISCGEIGDAYSAFIHRVIGLVWNKSPEIRKLAVKAIKSAPADSQQAEIYYFRGQNAIDAAIREEHSHVILQTQIARQHLQSKPLSTERNQAGDAAKSESLQNVLSDTRTHNLMRSIINFSK